MVCNPLKRLRDNLRMKRGCPVPCSAARRRAISLACWTEFHPVRQINVMEDHNAQFISTLVCRATGSSLHPNENRSESSFAGWQFGVRWRDVHASADRLNTTYSTPYRTDCGPGRMRSGYLQRRAWPGLLQERYARSVHDAV